MSDELQSAELQLRQFYATAVAIEIEAGTRDIRRYVLAINSNADIQPTMVAISRENGVVESMDRLERKLKALTYTNFVVNEGCNQLDLLGTKGWADYPAFDYTGVMRANDNHLTVIAKVFDYDSFMADQSKDPITVGVICTNNTGRAFKFTLLKARALYEEGSITNGIVDDDDFHPLDSRTTYPYIAYSDKGVQKTKTLGDMVNKKKLASDIKLVSAGLSTALVMESGALVDEMLSGDRLATVELIKANVGKLDPVLDQLLQKTPLMVTTRVDTMAASEDSIAVNPEFVATMTPQQGTFVLVHELYHILFNHRAVWGYIYQVEGAKANHGLFNVAADMIINDLICKDYGIKQYGGPDPSNLIQTPDMGCFVDSDVDMSKWDNVVSLYYQLLEENPDFANDATKQKTLAEVMEDINGEHNKKPPKSDGQGGSDGGMPIDLGKAMTTKQRVEAIQRASKELRSVVEGMYKHAQIDGDTKSALIGSIDNLNEGLEKVNREQCVKAIESFGNAIVALGR